MKEMNRTNFRPRAVDPSKSLHVFHDIDEVYKKEDNFGFMLKDHYAEYKNESKNIIEYEKRKIIELFDKKKSIIIPKVLQKEKPLQSNGEGKFTTHTVSYQQTEFVRPKHYIVYSEKNRLEPLGKDYDATVVDINFLKFENFFISVEELEKIISALENDINKGEMIPPERVREIILSIIPDKKQHVEKIYKYWHTRREDFKKSLLRKFWKDQKFTDKHLATTFRRREREKMKTRRNKKNEFEGIQKVKEIKETTKKYLMDVLSFMKERETTKRNLIHLQQIEFEAELNLLKNVKTNYEEKWKDFNKIVIKQTKTPSFYPPDEKKEEKRIETEKQNVPTIGKDEANLFKNEQMNIATEKTDSSFHNENQKAETLQKKKKKKKEKKPSPIIPSSIIVLPTTPSIPQPEQKQIEKVIKRDVSFLKHRIRFNKYKNLVIDRYIQIPNSTCPFDDDFNVIATKLKKYNEDFVYSKKKKLSFDNLYEDFLKGRYNRIIESDSDDDNSDFTPQVKTFSSSFKQFLKQKRNYSEVLTN